MVSEFLKSLSKVFQSLRHGSRFFVYPSSILLMESKIIVAMCAVSMYVTVSLVTVIVLVYEKYCHSCIYKHTSSEISACIVLNLTSQAD